MFPKLLFQQPLELDIVSRSGVPFDPGGFLRALGGAQALSGIAVLLLPRTPRAWLLIGQSAALLILPLLVAIQEPNLLAHPFGPLTKNAPILVGTLTLAWRDAGQGFLTARWSHVALVTHAVPPELLRPHLPSGVELDLFEGRALVSLASLDFSHTRVLGIVWPGFRAFPDVNLRTYVRRGEARGVVFLRELVPSRVVALAARTLCREPFLAVPLASVVEETPERVTVTRRFQVGGREHVVRFVASRAEAPIAPGSLEAFVVERHLGFGRPLCYRVERPPWGALPIESAQVEVDWAAAYGPEWAFLSRAEPLSIVLAPGSQVSVSLAA